MKNITFGGIPPRAYSVTPKIIAGPKPTHKQLKELKKEGVGLVIDLRRRKYFSNHFMEKISCFLLGQKHVRLPMYLSKKLPDKTFFEKIIEMTEKTNQKTYVHCSSGRHRSGFVAAAIRIIKEKITPKQAIDELIEKGYWQIDKAKNEEIRFHQSKNQEIKLQELREMFDAYRA